ncbi:MAG: choice-of-anchor D domain-containing protein [Bacteroidetes bacterium]|nr:choice-of-anchor D domain-containing protein [Bacteroidota bacterium]
MIQIIGQGDNPHGTWSLSAIDDSPSGTGVLCVHSYAISYTLTPASEINVVGNGANNILDNDNTPNTTDGTDFGAQNFCSGQMINTYTVQNLGTTNLTIENPTIQGTHASDFAIISNPLLSISPGGSTTFEVSFDPSAAGTRSATVSIKTDDCSELIYDFSIQGTGSGSAITTNTVSITNVSCNGGSNGSATILASGGAGVYTYDWAPGNPTGDGTASVTGLIAQAYTCTVTDANSCTAAQTINVTAPTALVVTAASQTNIACFGGSNGAAEINTPTGGTGTYNYNWTPGNPTGDGTLSVNGLTAQVYTSTVTDANGCTATQTFNLTAPTTLSVVPVSQTNLACFGGSNGAAAIDIPTGGVGGYTYDWTPGNPTGDGTTSVNGLTAQVYTCTVTDLNGCVIIQPFNLTQPATSLLVSAAVTSNYNGSQISCNGMSDAVAMATATGGAGSYSYAWANGQPTAIAPNLSAGVYTYTVTDVNGCTATSSLTITAPAAVSTNVGSQTDVLCNGGTTGTLTASSTGGTGSYSYVWSNGQTTATAINLSAGVYTYTVTDVNGCSTSSTGTITEPTTAISSSAMVTSNYNGSQISCNGVNDAEATATATGGTGAYTYVWSNGQITALATNLGAAVYSYTVTDANGCTSSSSVAITEPTALSTNLDSQTNVLCNGGTTGEITTSTTGGTGAYSYLWSDGQTTATANNLAAGVYTYTVTDVNGCSSTSSATVTQPTSALSATAAVTSNYNGAQISCNGSSNAEATGTVIGGTGAYSFAWSNGQPTAVAPSLGAGVYTYTVTDANGCTATSSVTITEPSAISTSIASQTNVLCNGGTTGILEASSTGGTGSYSYAWSDGQTTVSAINLAAGVYTYTVTDVNGCSSVSSATITESAAIASSQSFTVCAGQSVIVGSSSYSANGTYTDVLVAMNGCDSTVTTNLTVESVIDLTTNVSAETITANAIGATYQWIDCSNNTQLSGETNASFTATSNGDYAVVVTVGSCSDTSACVNIASVGIKSNVLSSKTTIIVYPNPSKGIFNFNGIAINDKIEVYNSLGNLVMNEVSNSNKFTLNLSELSNGVYLVKVKSNTGDAIIKIVKND